MINKCPYCQRRIVVSVEKEPPPLADGITVLSIDHLKLTVRARNALTKAGFNTIGEVITRSRRDLRRIINIGKTTLDEIESALAGVGKVLAND